MDPVEAANRQGLHGSGPLAGPVLPLRPPRVNSQARLRGVIFVLVVLALVGYHLYVWSRVSALEEELQSSHSELHASTTDIRSELDQVEDRIQLPCHPARGNASHRGGQAGRQGMVGKPLSMGRGG